MKKILVMILVLMMLTCGMAAAESEARRMETAADAEEWMAVFLGEQSQAFSFASFLSLALVSLGIIIVNMKFRE